MELIQALINDILIDFLLPIAIFSIAFGLFVNLFQFISIYKDRKQSEKGTNK
ncbi:hypothetical protein [Pseudofulvibacter geojedonensis]|uniref:Uncharacterized protein n=1 Tax=Pseudofulvibacter geojedonensis TaxID=1123758 RepID=A0ABW3I277_9FLAO